LLVAQRRGYAGCGSAGGGEEGLPDGLESVLAWVREGWWGDDGQGIGVSGGSLWDWDGWVFFGWIDWGWRRKVEIGALEMMSRKISPSIVIGVLELLISHPMNTHSTDNEECQIATFSCNLDIHINTIDILQSKE
jgi:hypothetical protein